MSKTHFGKRKAPFSLRLSFEERTKIEASAGTMPVGAYIKSLLLADDAPRYRARVKSPVKDTQALAELLACLGSSRIANNLNQLAHAANIGNLYFDTDTKIQISQACSDVRIMRQLLMQALDMKLGDEPRPKQSTSQSFARASTAKKFSL